MTTATPTEGAATGTQATPAVAPTTPTAPAPAQATSAASSAPKEAPAEAKPPTGLIGEIAKPKEGDAGKAPAEATAPESYDFKMPEGVRMSKDVLDQFGELAKAGKLSQEQAQEALGKFVQARQREVETEVTRLAAEAKADLLADPEIGGDKWPATQASIKRALDAFGDPEAVEVLTHPMVGNNRAIARMLAKIGAHFREDRFTTGQSAPTGPSFMETFYKEPSRS